MRADRRRRGISLLEVVVGLAIVAMTALGALSAAAAELRAAARARRALEAAALATERLGRVDLLAERELRVLPDSLAQGRFAPPFDGYQWHTTTTPREREPGVYEVSIRLAWEGGAYTIHSALYRRPLVTRP